MFKTSCIYFVLVFYYLDLAIDFPLIDWVFFKLPNWHLVNGLAAIL